MSMPTHYPVTLVDNHGREYQAYSATDYVDGVYAFGHRRASTAVRAADPEAEPDESPDDEPAAEPDDTYTAPAYTYTDSFSTPNPDTSMTGD